MRTRRGRSDWRALEAERGAADPGSTERQSARAVETIGEDLVLHGFAQAQHGELVQRRISFGHTGDDNAAVAVASVSSAVGTTQ